MSVFKSVDECPLFKIPNFDAFINRRRNQKFHIIRERKWLDLIFQRDKK